jgi:hypothetical protein
MGTRRVRRRSRLQHALMPRNGHVTLAYLRTRLDSGGDRQFSFAVRISCPGKKINTAITQTKRHYPVCSGVIDKLAAWACDQQERR